MVDKIKPPPVKKHPNYRDITFIKKDSNGIEDDFAFTDDVLTACLEKQEAVLKVLKKKYGKGYGQPKKGSMTDKRGKKYQKSVNEEVVDLCSMIAIQGTKNKDGSIWVRFGDLFRVYQGISNKVVGIMHRARKNRLIHFDGETLWQGKDDNATVTLLLSFSEIQAHLLKTGKLLLNQNDTYIVARELSHTHLLNVKYGSTEMLETEDCQNFPIFQSNLTSATVSQEGFFCNNTATAMDGPKVEVFKIATRPKKQERPISRVVLDFGGSSLCNSDIQTNQRVPRTRFT